MSSPHIHVKRIAWDGWEAVVEDRPLVRAIAPTAAEAVEAVLQKLRELEAAASGEEK